MKPTKPSSSGGLVYSTEHGRMCPDCRQLVAQCQCRKKSTAPIISGPVRVRRETKGRKGAGVTVILGVPLDTAGLTELAKVLKKKCGSGGTVKDGNIEIQGDHVDTLLAELARLGWAAKRAGG